jgi:Galactose oxidase, central domain
MASKVPARILTLTIPLLLATLGSTAQSPNAPAGRFHHSGVYDEARKQFLIYGGFTWDQGTKRVGDVWGWDGTKWQLVGDTGVRKIVAPLAFDSKRQRTMMFGGNGDSTTDGNLSTLNRGVWQLVKDLPSLARMDASLIYDSKRDHLVLFGGLNDQVFFAGTWEYDGSDWKATFMPGPSLRSSAATVYDSARGVTVLYGGFRPLAALGDTWEWNGEQWKLVSESGPGPRSWPGIAYDSKRARTILFGGEDEKGRFYSDTWAWDGKTWTCIANEGPPARIQTAMGYDSLRDRIVLFGGVKTNPQGILDDLWEFDGTRWTQKQP